jgi:nucleoside-diphosphate-sugar epimerase
MKVAVFGATGGIGRLVVDELLASGHSVKAYIRQPSKAPASWNGRNVDIHIGELHESSKVEAAVADVNAVVSALGPSMDKGAQGFPLIDGTRNILQAMRRYNVRRFIGHATPSFKDPSEKLTWDSRLIGFLGRTLFPRGYKELLGMCELIVGEPDLDWTIIRFIAPNDKPKTGEWKIGFFGKDSIRWAATRGDIAALTAKQVESRDYIRRAPVISS